MLGAPASGKGTQAARLASHFTLPNLSTGALIRAEQQRGSAIGKLADQFLQGGGFLPDECIVEIMEGWLADNASRGFVLDGFPRTLPQAEAFDAILARAGLRADVAVLLETDSQTLQRRVANRVHCNHCGGTFRLDPPDIVAGSPCPQADCQEVLQLRSDDEPSTFAGRLAKYHQLTEPVIQHYDRCGVLKRVDGNRAPDEVFETILAQLGICATTSTN